MSGMMYAPSKGGAPDVVLQYRENQGVPCQLSVHSTWKWFNTNFILSDPKSLVILAGNQFTFAKDGFLEVIINTYGNTDVKFRISSDTGTLFYCGLGNLNGYGFGSVPGAAALKMQINAAYSEGQQIGAAVNNGPEIYSTLKYWAK
jgi:hypothetical protein